LPQRAKPCGWPSNGVAGWQVRSADVDCGKEFVKPIPYEELEREIEIFCDLFAQPAVEEGLRKFVENEGVQPYLP